MIWLPGFPNWIRLVGGHFGQNGQNQMNENDGQANFSVSGGDTTQSPYYGRPWLLKITELKYNTKVQNNFAVVI